MNSAPKVASLSVSLLVPVFLAACGPMEPSEPYVKPPLASATRVFYTVTNVEGWYGGDGEKTMAPGWVDKLTLNLCSFKSSGTVATQNPFIGDPQRDTYSKGITVTGLARCPGALATSTENPGCSSDPLVLEKALFQWDIDIAGYEDDSLVTLTSRAPGTPPTCNFASVLNDGTKTPWGLQATTTVGKFREGKPFDVRFVGERTLKGEGSISQVKWDLTVTIAPKQ